MEALKRYSSDSPRPPDKVYGLKEGRAEKGKVKMDAAGAEMSRPTCQKSAGSDISQDVLDPPWSFKLYFLGFLTTQAIQIQNTKQRNTLLSWGRVPSSNRATVKHDPGWVLTGQSTHLKPKTTAPVVFSTIN